MQLNEILAKLSKEMKISYTFKGKPLPYEEVFSAHGLLPGLAKRADQLASLAIGYGIGAQIDAEENTLLGKRVAFDEYTPFALRVLCFLDVIAELAKNSPSPNVVSLDELSYD
jgi:intracellular multiplication protein IcmS